MEITIKKMSTRYLHGDPHSSDVTNTYLVAQDGRGFRIACRTHAHGSSLALEGEDAILYTDWDENSVRRQVITVGKACGISIESDEVVEGLSPWALRGVVMADRRKETGEIRIVIDESGENCDRPAILIDGHAAVLP